MKLKIFVSTLTLLAVSSVHAGTLYTYTDWTSATDSSGATPGSASGTLTFGSNVVNVGYAGEVTFAQINNIGTNYYNLPTDFTGSVVANAPGPDIIALQEASAFTDTLTFSQPLVNPVIDIVSLGAGNTVGYNFNATPIILSQGTDDWGGCDTCLSVSGNTVDGAEGTGAVEFVGSYSSIAWTPTGGEYWNGVTVGAAAIGTGGGTTATPEPGSLLLVGSGITGLVGMLRRRRVAARS